MNGAPGCDCGAVILDTGYCSNCGTQCVAAGDVESAAVRPLRMTEDYSAPITVGSLALIELIDAGSDLAARLAEVVDPGRNDGFDQEDSAAVHRWELAALAIAKDAR